MEVDVDVDADVREAQTASTAASGEMLAAHACTHLTSILGRPSLRIRGRREFEGPVPVPVPRAIQSSRNLKWAHLRLRGRGARWPASAVVLALANVALEPGERRRGRGRREHAHVGATPKRGARRVYDVDLSLQSCP